MPHIRWQAELLWLQFLSTLYKLTRKLESELYVFSKESFIFIEYMYIYIHTLIVLAVLQQRNLIRAIIVKTRIPNFILFVNVSVTIDHFQY